MKSNNYRDNVLEPDNALAPDEAPSAVVLESVNIPQPPAWEEIEPGRFQPKRICGSNVGRELG